MGGGNCVAEQEVLGAVGNSPTTYQTRFWFWFDLRGDHHYHHGGAVFGYIEYIITTIGMCRPEEGSQPKVTALCSICRTTLTMLLLWFHNFHQTIWLSRPMNIDFPWQKSHLTAVDQSKAHSGMMDCWLTDWFTMLLHFSLPALSWRIDFALPAFCMFLQTQESVINSDSFIEWHVVPGVRNVWQLQLCLTPLSFSTGWVGTPAPASKPHSWIFWQCQDSEEWQLISFCEFTVPV